MIDLHVHTTCSDGRLSVREVLERAISQGITKISFCDHNVVTAYKILEDNNYFGLRDKINIVTGVEFDFIFEHKDFHLLGYGFDWKKMNESRIINKKTEEQIIEEEREKLEFLKNVCRAKGIKFSEDLDIKGKNDKASTVLKYDMMKFEENNAILDEMLGTSRERSFARGFVGNPKSDFFIDSTKGLPTFEEVADIIHICGGKVFLAHPFDYKDLDSREFINKIYNTGLLNGIEAIHTRHTPEQITYIRQFCSTHNLMVSGGSDFHRDGKQKLGYGVSGTVAITDEYDFHSVLHSIDLER